MASHREGLVRVHEEMEEHQRCGSVAHEPDVDVGRPPHDVRHVRLQLYLVPDGVDYRPQEVKQRPLNSPSTSKSIDGGFKRTADHGG